VEQCRITWYDSQNDKDQSKKEKDHWNRQQDSAEDIRPEGHEFITWETKAECY
jgi:hypothetical protein